ncbi:MAG: DUF2171 domain-containing protein [Thermomicrobia bacterium]|nr:DUF2171 domain-containing protein [Thermomicrobia bacterium]
MVVAPTGYDGTVSRMDDSERLHAGMDVYGSDGHRIGTLADIGRDSFLVQDGLFSIKNMYLPKSAVAEVDETGISLTVAKDEAEAMARADLPAEGDPWYGASPATVRTTEIPLREQIFVMQTVATVTSEVTFRKKIVRESERVTTTARRVVVRVEDTTRGRVHVEDERGDMHSADEGGDPWQAGR